VASDLEKASVLASAANQEAAEGLLGEDDMQTELKELVEKKVAPGKDHKRAAAHAGNATAQVEASPAASSSKPKIPMMAHISLSVARQWAPPASVLILDVKRHMMGRSSAIARRHPHNTATARHLAQMGLS